MADPRTINIGGSRAATQQFELAPGLLQYVQSVYVEIDNSAGAAARPTLTLSEQSGVVIAKKRQGESIPAAGTGSATWALRLDDERESTALANQIGFYDVEPIGGNPWNAASTLTALNFSFGGSGAGTDLLDLTTYGAAAPLPKVAGMYAVAVALFFTPGGGGTFAANKTVRVVLLLANAVRAAVHLRQGAVG
jgi:hypothetical protein